MNKAAKLSQITCFISATPRQSPPYVRQKNKNVSVLCLYKNTTHFRFYVTSIRMSGSFCTLFDSCKINFLKHNAYEVTFLTLWCCNTIKTVTREYLNYFLHSFLLLTASCCFPPSHNFSSQIDQPCKKGVKQNSYNKWYNKLMNYLFSSNKMIRIAIKQMAIDMSEKSSSTVFVEHGLVDVAWTVAMDAIISSLYFLGQTTCIDEDVMNCWCS